MDTVLLSYLHKSNIYTIDGKQLKHQLLSHSEYPSVKSVTDTLDYFGVENMAVNVPKTAFDELPNYFLALIKTSRISQPVLASKENGKVYLLSGKGAKNRITEDHFFKIWTGTLIVVEPKTTGREFSLVTRLKKNTLTLLLIVALISIFWFTTATVRIFGLLSLMGLGISILFIKESLGTTDGITKKICGLLSNKKTDCQVVAKNSKGYIFQNIELVDIALVYFLSVGVTVITINVSIISLYVISAITLPIVLYTLYLQKYKMRSWCFLCVGLSVILISQFIIVQFAQKDLQISLYQLFKIVLLFGFFLILWRELKVVLQERNQSSVVLNKFYAFKRDRNVFLQTITNTENTFENSLTNASLISFGNSDAPIVIDAIINPLCSHCKETFKAYDHLLKEHPNDILLNLIFNVLPDLEKLSTQIAHKFIGLYGRDRGEAYTTIRDWFITGNTKAAKETSIVPNSIIENIASEHYDCCVANAIHYAPETYVQGFLFPTHLYEIEDLQFFLEDLKKVKPDIVTPSLSVLKQTQTTSVLKCS